MPKGVQSLAKRQNLVYLLITALVVAIDQFSKAWIRLNLALGQSIPPSGFFRLTRVHNTGAAFGLFPDLFLPLTIFVAISGVVLLLFFLFFADRFRFGNYWLGRLSLVLILGGTIGNLVDRLTLGYITDFIDVGIWPSFNVADSAVVVGTVLLAYAIITRGTSRTDDPL